LLNQRVLTLLERVDQPEAVLAITFTKKAAGEMRLRIVKALRESVGPRPEEEHKALTWELAVAVRQRSEALGWNLFSNPARLRIRTIDSLCAALTAQMPWVSRMGAAPDIVEAPGELYVDAARRTIELLETRRCKGCWPECWRGATSGCATSPVPATRIWRGLHWKKRSAT
jgi:ATP-dependent exoDNAse (exonuclease V) beta subunit